MALTSMSLFLLPYIFQLAFYITKEICSSPLLVFGSIIVVIVVAVDPPPLLEILLTVMKLRCLGAILKIRELQGC